MTLLKIEIEKNLSKSEWNGNGKKSKPIWMHAKSHAITVQISLLNWVHFVFINYKSLSKIWFENVKKQVEFISNTHIMHKNCSILLLDMFYIHFKKVVWFFIWLVFFIYFEFRVMWWVRLFNNFHKIIFKSLRLCQFFT